jgi:hypothetical protein
VRYAARRRLSASSVNARPAIKKTRPVTTSGYDSPPVRGSDSDVGDDLPIDVDVTTAEFEAVWLVDVDVVVAPGAAVVLVVAAAACTLVVVPPTVVVVVPSLGGSDGAVVVACCVVVVVVGSVVVVVGFSVDVEPLECTVVVVAGCVVVVVDGQVVVVVLGFDVDVVAGTEVVVVLAFVVVVGCDVVVVAGVFDWQNRTSERFGWLPLPTVKPKLSNEPLVWAGANDVVIESGPAFTIM